MMITYHKLSFSCSLIQTFSETDMHLVPDYKIFKVKLLEISYAGS